MTTLKENRIKINVNKNERMAAEKEYMSLIW